ncbi:MAG: preprotein translocase subunit SecG [Kiritimatiellae bacterium]|jgi:preprotein translocase subunit SecG|nr:preprotein translocase subunit SecG [Kiritimatiellia bacterium]
MLIIKYISLFLEVVISLMLIGVVLLQRSKGQGIGAVFGGGAGDAIFGAQLGNVLTKVTIVLAIIFMVNTTFLAWIGSQTTGNSIVNELESSPIPVAPAQQPATTGLPMTTGE